MLNKYYATCFILSMCFVFWWHCITLNMICIEEQQRHRCTGVEMHFNSQTFGLVSPSGAELENVKK